MPHMWKRWDAPRNVFLEFTGEHEKQLFIKKTVEVEQ